MSKKTQVKDVPQHVRKVFLNHKCMQEGAQKESGTGGKVMNARNPLLKILCEILFGG